MTDDRPPDGPGLPSPPDEADGAVAGTGTDTMADSGWQTLIDPDRLAGWMDRQGLGHGPLQGARLLSGGTQNLLLRFERAGVGYVLRRPPRHSQHIGSQTMRREARVLAALAGSRVPHARLLAACDDDAVLGAAFYLMAPVDGFNPVAGLPALHRHSPALRHRMSLAMVEAIVALGQLDAVALGLADFGKVDGYLERQVGRWRSQLDSYHSLAGWPGPAALPEVAAVGRWLDQRRPASFRPGLIHGDFHLANVMFRFDSGELAALVDWELSTLGDPLLDLGWLLATWPDADGASTVDFQLEPAQGWASATELVAHYAQQSGRDLGGIAWYAVLACYKLGIILEGTFARACAGQAAPATGQRLHRHAVALFERAARWIAAGPAQRLA